MSTINAAKGQMKALETSANKYLAELASEKRPENSKRSRIQSVAILTMRDFEATDREGHTECVGKEIVRSWLAA